MASSSRHSSQHLCSDIKYSGHVQPQVDNKMASSGTAFNMHPEQTVATAMHVQLSGKSVWYVIDPQSSAAVTKLLHDRVTQEVCMRSATSGSSSTITSVTSATSV